MRILDSEFIKKEEIRPVEGVKLSNDLKLEDLRD